MMVLGSLNPDIFAFVYNPFSVPHAGTRQNHDHAQRQGRAFRSQLHPPLHSGLLETIRLDIVAALAPRPVICTEGGLDRDFQLISSQPTVWPGRRIISSTITSPGLRTLPNAGTAANCPQV